MTERINLRRTSKTTYHADTMGGYITVWKAPRGWLARFVSAARPMDGTDQSFPKPKVGWETDIEQPTPHGALQALCPWLHQ